MSEVNTTDYWPTQREQARAREKKYTPGFALEAVIQQLRQWKNQGAGEINFGALASHPETDEGCTFGDLIDPASAQFQLISDCLPLITAAPDLLEACKRLVAERCNTPMMIKSANTAIAKAEGRQ